MEDEKELKPKKNWIKCPNCGYEGEGKKYTRGSFWIEIILWILGIVLGLIYSLWRLSSRYIGCPKCGYRYIVKQSPEAKSRKWLLIIGGLFVLIVIIAIVSGGEKKEAITPSGGTITIPSKTEFRVGEEIKVGNFSVIINSVKVVPKWVNIKSEGWRETYYYVAKPKEGYKIVLIEHTTKNNGKEEDSLDFGFRKLETTEGYIYESRFYRFSPESTTENLEKEYCPEDSLGYAFLLPRESEHGYEGFEIPEDLEPAKLLIYKTWGEKPDIIVNLK